MVPGDWVRLAGFPGDPGGQIIGPAPGLGSPADPAWLVRPSPGQSVEEPVPWFESELELVIFPGVGAALHRPSAGWTHMAEPSAANGYRGARFLRDTPYSTVTEWRRAMIAAIPDAEKCPSCSGTGADVIRASNGGVGEVVRCWPCEGTGRRRKEPHG